MTMPTAEKVYVVEVGGVAILTFAAANWREAQSLVREQWLREDLREAIVAGRPIWDGAAKISIRNADADENMRYAAGAKQADADPDDLTLVYLVERDG